MRKSVPESRETPVSGFRLGIAFIWQEAVLEHFVRRVVTNSFEISFQKPQPTVLTANRGNAMIM
jgi:hypothetical protein